MVSKYAKFDFQWTNKSLLKLQLLFILCIKTTSAKMGSLLRMGAIPSQLPYLSLLIPYILSAHKLELRIFYIPIQTICCETATTNIKPIIIATRSSSVDKCLP